MVGFDAHFVMLALRPAIPASVDHAKERVLSLLYDLQMANEKILVPTPALTEFLVHAEEAGPRYLDELQKSSRFKIAAYGVRAAVEVAAAIESAVTKKDKRNGTRDTWAKVNFDRQIAGIAKVEGCHTIYTDDKGITHFAESLGLKVVALADLKLPASSVPPPLIQAMESHDEQKKAAAQYPLGLQTNNSSGAGNPAGEEVEEEGKDEEA